MCRQLTAKHTGAICKQLACKIQKESMMKLLKNSYLCKYESRIVHSISSRSAYLISLKSFLGHLLCHLPWFSVQPAACYTAVSILYSSAYIHTHLQVHMSYLERNKALSPSYYSLFALKSTPSYLRFLRCGVGKNREKRKAHVLHM